ncbi:MAG: SAM-dependent methyltransferase [Eubacteriales bacterium]
MERLQGILQQSFNIDFIRIIISNPKSKEGILKIKIRPITLKDTLYFQCETFTKTQAFQKNCTGEEAVHLVLEWMQEFKQMQMETTKEIYTVLVSKKGKVTIQKKLLKTEIERVETTHNRKKQYILEEGTVVPFLQELGVMTTEGKIVKSRYDKFKQINRFLEFIEDIVPKLATDREITIIDFGCGKSYLTFAMYYYLHDLRKYDVRIIGLDLKKDVIEHCSRLSENYGYEKLMFLQGDIADYTGVDKVDMVVTLHACDTATDIALAKAVKWDAEVILSVPCCQHELNQQIRSDVLAPIFKYGLIQERIASLVTDGLRAEYLTGVGYDVQVLEFIDMDHTPKNILIRGIKTEKKLDNKKDIDACKELLNIDPMLGRLLDS